MSSLLKNVARGGGTDSEKEAAQTALDNWDIETELLERIKQYEDLRDMVKEFTPLIREDGNSLLEGNLLGENGNLGRSSSNSVGERFDKRRENVDKEVNNNNIF